MIGIQGLIATSDPEGVKRPAADWNELAGAADVYPIIIALMGYSNQTDPSAIQALAALALRRDAEPALRQNAAYALSAIHTKATLPALVALPRRQDGARPVLRAFGLMSFCAERAACNIPVGALAVVDASRKTCAVSDAGHGAALLSWRGPTASRCGFTGYVLEVLVERASNRALGPMSLS